jgi:hypothetical protein
MRSDIDPRKFCLKPGFASGQVLREAQNGSLVLAHPSLAGQKKRRTGVRLFSLKVTDIIRRP